MDGTPIDYFWLDLRTGETFYNRRRPRTGLTEISPLYHGWEITLDYTYQCWAATKDHYFHRLFKIPDKYWQEAKVNYVHRRLTQTNLQL